MHVAASNDPDLADPRLRKALRRNNLPLTPPAERSWAERTLRSKWTWLTLAVLVLEATCLYLLYARVVPDRPVPGGMLVGTGTEALRPAGFYAALTVIPLTLLFLWSDRFRPHGFWVWLVVFGWGGSVATYVSLVINTASAAHMSIVGDGDPASSSRVAVFVAPFVEEAAKASVLFLVAILFRYRWVSRLSGIALAGLTAASFAFVENIVYYGQTYRAAARTSGVADPEAMVFQHFLHRGVYTFFGHPLFTIMTGIGLALALRSKSKLVRVLAPVTGFLAAVLLHMLFNGFASTNPPIETLLMTLALVAYPMVISLAIYTIRQLFVEKRLIEARLTDYARMGWVPDSEPRSVSRLSTRLRVLWQSLWEGRFLWSWRLQRTLTELAYLRDAMARGLVDDTGLVREKQLLLKAQRLRGHGFAEPRPRTGYPWTKPPPAPVVWGPPVAAPGVRHLALGGDRPAPAYATAWDADRPGGMPLGSSATTYSPVDPRWKPPAP